MALDKNKANSLFGGFKQHPAVECKTPFKEQKSIESDIVASSAKWKSLDKVTVLLTQKQKEGLDAIAKKLMKHRSKNADKAENRERITANMLIRGLIDNLLEREEDLILDSLNFEHDVKLWLSKTYRKKID